MRAIGLILFIIGVTVALISAAKLPAVGTQWSNLIFIYVIAVLQAIIGLILFYTSRKNVINQIDKSTGTNCPNMIELLRSLLGEMKTLANEIHQLDAVAIATQIDHLMDTLVPFTTEREEILLRLGKVAGIKTLLAMAQGEHLLNRVWSAASDGHLTEARAIYPQALVAFEQALAQCKNYNSNL